MLLSHHVKRPLAPPAAKLGFMVRVMVGRRVPPATATNSQAIGGAGSLSTHPPHISGGEW